jgi:hypothetical protein
VLPAQSVCLVVPVVPPSEYEDKPAIRDRQLERVRRRHQPAGLTSES